jgi:monoamine oxidase
VIRSSIRPEINRDMGAHVLANDNTRRRIHFAGEHTSACTGWMQGTLESARRVVREINE